MSGAELATLLDRHGFDFYTGVPCSLVEDLIAALECHRRAPWIPAVREDVALGLAAGAWLGGRRPVVVMQNSGLGTSLNALASLSLMYGLPALLIVTWRGFGGQDAPEHLLMGEISPRLLDLLGILTGSYAPSPPTSSSSGPAERWTPTRRLSRSWSRPVSSRPEPEPGQGSTGPVPAKRQRTPRTRMEPSRRGAANARRVVRRPLPRLRLRSRRRPARRTRNCIR